MHSLLSIYNAGGSPNPVHRHRRSQKSHVKTLLLMVLLFCCSILSTGCSSSEKEKNAQVFFTAFNHLLEADTLQIQGDFSMGQIASDYQLFVDQSSKEKCLELALILGNPDSKDPADSIGFYIKDGKTYLNYMGEKTQSLAENIGIVDGKKLDVYNPFLDYSDAERADFFDSITKNTQNNTWTFELDPTSLGLLLDPLGSAHITDAVMNVTFNDENEISSLNLDIKGTIIMGVSTADLSITFKMDHVIENEPVTFPWPDDLNTYKTGDSSLPDLAKDTAGI